MANSKLFITDNNYQSYQSSTIKKGSLTRIKESKWAINFISKLIYWFNFLRIYFQKTHLRAQAQFFIGKRLVRLGTCFSLLSLAKNYCQFSIGDAFAMNPSNSR